MKYRKWGIAFIVGLAIGVFRLEYPVAGALQYPWRGEGIEVNVSFLIGAGLGGMLLLAILRGIAATPRLIRRVTRKPAPRRPPRERAEPHF